MQKQINILNTVLGDPNRVGKELLYTCPKCNHHKKKLSVNLSKAAFKCWVCDFSGKNIAYLIKRYGHSHQYRKWVSLVGGPLSVPDDSEKDLPELRLPEGFSSLCTTKNPLSHRGYRNYLSKRGVGFSDILRWKIGFCSEGRFRDRIIIPSFDAHGELNYFVARTTGDHYIKYLNPSASKDIIFNELAIDWSKPITIVEGVFDAMKFENSIPLLGSTMPIKGKLFSKIVESKSVVYLGLDADAKSKEEKIIRNMLLYGVEVYQMSRPETGDYADLTKEECSLFKEKANFVHSTDYLLYQKIFSEEFLK